jgi:hypothetical protein
MSQQVLEGTWEEIVEHSDELSGRRVRLIVIDESAIPSGRELSVEERPLAELLDGLVGVIDSREPFPTPERQGDAFGEGVIAKLKKQGLKLP